MYIHIDCAYSILDIVYTVDSIFGSIHYISYIKLYVLYIYVICYIHFIIYHIL